MFAAPADVGVALFLVPLIAWGTVTVGRLVLGDDADAHPLDLGPALGLGVSLFSLAVLAVGFVSTSRQAFGAVIGLFLVAGVPAWRRTLSYVADGTRRIRSIEGAVLAAIICGVVLLCLVSGARPPGARDEIDYHWAGPVAWVAEGRWIELPTIRLVNAPALAERLYTVAAAFDSSTAAHWLHTLFFVCLIASAGRVAHAFGGRAAVAMAVVTSVPVLLNQASIAYNDIAFAALLVAAAATALSARDARRWAAVGAMVAAAILVKPLAAVFAPALALLVLLAQPVERSIVAGAVAGGATLGLGAAYNLAVLGSLGPRSEGFELRRFTDQPMAAGRLPVLTDLLLVPFLPLFAAVAGNREPYGGRTGVVFLVYLPAMAVWLVARRSIRGWDGARVLPAAGLALVVAAVFSRTRFHGVTWTLLAVAVSTVPWVYRSQRAEIIFILCVLAGVADSARVLLRPW